LNHLELTMQTDATEYKWQRQSEADRLFRSLVDDFCSANAFANDLRQRMLTETGTRLIDWVDHLSVAGDTEFEGQPIEGYLESVGFEADAEDQFGKWFVHRGGLFPAICIGKEKTVRLVIEIESVCDFLAAHRLHDLKIEGQRGGEMRRVKISSGEGNELWACERCGYNSWEIPSSAEAKVLTAAQHLENFLLRNRACGSDEASFQLTKELCNSAIKDLGINWACSLFFAAERDYWQRRNHAARVQKGRQDRLGLGWGNHDHHTYRSSRQAFAPMIEIFELLGFHCRERFYAGNEAGWGAQVLGPPGCGIVIFADVDLTSEELAGDFAHQGLTSKSEVGTVGLWCELHGEALMQAGMHHLECTFDFDTARKQLAEVGVDSMQPFTDEEHLRQAFTVGEIWQVDPQRIEGAVERKLITREQADKFLAKGSIGSHLEILERNDGYKGFNQTGVSEIILKTDPRKADQASR